MVVEFSSLTEYEVGKSLVAIEWVARSQKPIVEVGGRPLKGCDVRSLASDLNLCIKKSGESVRAFLMPDGAPGYCCYGFYRYAWAMKAMLCLWSKKRWPSGRYGWLWLQGLLFGYSADAIQKFILSAFDGREPKLHSIPCSGFCRWRRVEMYGTPARLFQRRSTPNGKFLKRN